MNFRLRLNKNVTKYNLKSYILHEYEYSLHCIDQLVSIQS